MSDIVSVWDKNANTPYGRCSLAKMFYHLARFT